ncbi:hypothetical protein UT300003_07740 [Clostridium sardiniense]
MESFDIIGLVFEILSPLKVDVIEGWYDKDLNKTHITVHEYLEQDENFIDDENTEVEHNIQIDVWSTDSIESENLKNKIKKLLKSNDFLYDQGESFYETDTKIYHKGMRFNYTEELE